jgi:pyruvate,water dikinase
MAMTEEFAVTWDDPADALLTWMQDRMHAPEPGTPLGMILAELVTHGFAFANDHYSIPMRFRMQLINNWLYATVNPVTTDVVELERLGAEAERRLGETFANLGELWETSWLPEIQTLVGELESFDLQAATMNELIGHWDRMMEIGRRLFELHFVVINPSYIAVSEFDELYRRLFETTDPHESYRLLQGHLNKTFETGAAQWELSRRASRHPDVVKVLSENAGKDVLAGLAQVEGGPQFVEELQAYLAAYGQRGDLWDISYPSWIEDPTPVLNNLREYLGQDQHPADQLTEAAAERDRLVAQARERLGAEQREAFDFLLKAGSVGIVLTEDHGFWIDYKGMHQMRMVCVEMGRRFAEAGVIEDADDVFFLKADEVIETGRDLIDRRALVVQRRTNFELAKTVSPPPMLGPPPADDPDNPIARSQAKFFGGPPDPGTTATVIRGNPGSAGTVIGTARVLSCISEADQLQPGDVLVAKTTSPPWTPLFAIASAVVVDTGGIICHCAVVAREYGIPAVVGCGMATDLIHDGQTIEVDGTRGIVRIVD